MKPSTPVFLARKGYRLRRAMDAARFLPVLGAFLFILPLLWQGGLTGQGVIYLFVIWFVLIVLAAILARILKDPSLSPGDISEDGGDT
ncbi:MAG: hypothetical protein ACSHXD_16060 [Marinosulfonomonas sp.]